MCFAVVVEMCGLVGQILPRAAGELDLRTKILLAVVLGLLILAFIIGRVLKRQPESAINPAVVRLLNLRVRSWLLMYCILGLCFVLGQIATVVVFCLVSFWALREFITMTPTRRGDHRALFWTFFLFTPLQYVFVALGARFYELYTVMIPVYASLIIPARVAFSDDPKRFLERVAKIQAGLLICVYALSHAPALLSIPLHRSDGKPWSNQPQPVALAQAMSDDPQVASDMDPMPTEEPAATPPGQAAPAGTNYASRGNAGLLFFFILIVQLNDVLQYGWGKLLGRHVVAASINASRTWEGFVGGVLSTMLLGALLSWATPFQPWEAALMALVVAVMGFAGGMTMSAIKRDRGVTDYGTLVQGHAGVLDRIDSTCFAAPVFFHLTHYFYGISNPPF
jgi:phosphatidate cytidylyltransferase